MQEEGKVPSGEPAVNVSDAKQEVIETKQDEVVASGDTKTTPSYEYHKKLLGQHKNLKSQYEDLNSKFEKLNEDKLVAEGNKDELINQLRERLNNSETTFKQMKQNYAYNVVSSQVASEASKLGCLDTDALLKLSDISNLEVDDNYNLNKEQVKGLIESVKQEKPYLFQNKAPIIASGIPSKPDLSNKPWDQGNIKDKTELLKLALTNEKL